MPADHPTGEQSPPTVDEIRARRAELDLPRQYSGDGSMAERGYYVRRILQAKRVFSEHAAEDIDVLLARVASLEAENERLKDRIGVLEAELESLAKDSHDVWLDATIQRDAASDRVRALEAEIEQAYRDQDMLQAALSTERAARETLERDSMSIFWYHCSPSLLDTGVDCASAPRRTCHCGVGHDHLVLDHAATPSPTQDSAT